MSTETSALQCLQQAIAQIQHALGTRTWNTIYDWLTADLTLLNESIVVLEQESDKTTKCLLQPTNYHESDQELCVPADIMNTGDIKWLAMLAGMGNHSGCWCTHCLLSPSEWKEEGHQLGELRDVQSVQNAVVTHNMSDTTKSNPKFRGVSSHPFFPFLELSNFVVPLLHCRIGIFSMMQIESSMKGQPV
jgi:hypothetical protein